MTITTPAAPVLNLDLVYGLRDEPEPCFVCRMPVAPATTPVYELEEAASGQVLCRPCSAASNPELASTVAFLARLGAALDNGRHAQAREALEALWNGIELYYDVHGLTMPTADSAPARKPRTAPRRRGGRKRR